MELFSHESVDQGGSDTNAFGLNSKIINTLRRSGVNNSKAILLSTLNELSQLTKFSRLECQQVVNAASKATLKSHFVPCSDLKNARKTRLSIGCPILDQFLQGGFTFYGITEVSGESATGKTQVCLQLSILAQLPLSEGGLNGSVAYICTEDAFPSKRLHQIIQELRKQKPTLNNVSVTDNIFVTQIGDAESFKFCIQKTLPQLVACRNIKLIIVDSIAAVFRSDYDSDQNIHRSRDIQSIGYSLHQLAVQHNVVVVCVNQVTDVIDNKVTLLSMKRHVPSLGLAWSSLVTTRLMFLRTQRRTELYKRDNVAIRLAVPAVIFSMIVGFSPFLPSSNQAHFIVTPQGVFGLQSS